MAKIKNWKYLGWQTETPGSHPHEYWRNEVNGALVHVGRTYEAEKSFAFEHTKKDGTPIFQSREYHYSVVARKQAVMYMKRHPFGK